MNKITYYGKAPLLALIALLAVAQTLAQTTGLRLVPVRTLRVADETAAQVVPVPAEGTNAPAAGTNTPPTKASAPEDLATAIKAMNFSRTPDALLQAVKSQQTGSKLSEADKFRISVLLGDWESVGTALRTLPAADAMKAYQRLLESLASSSQSADQFYQQNPNQRNQPDMVMMDGDEQPNPNPPKP